MLVNNSNIPEIKTRILMKSRIKQGGFYSFIYVIFYAVPIVKYQDQIMSTLGEENIILDIIHRNYDQLIWGYLS